MPPRQAGRVDGCPYPSRAAGVPTGEGLQKAIADGVNSVMLPAGRQQGDMMDAADYLRRRGHTEDHINHIAGEFGKALKAAWEQLRGEDVVTNAAEFECQKIQRPRGRNVHGRGLQLVQGQAGAL